MSLGPQWCLGVLLGLLLPGQAPRARPGAFGTDLGSPLKARAGGDGLGGREDEWRRDASFPCYWAM